MFMTILGSIRGNAAAISKKLLAFGFGVKNRVVDTVFSVLEKLVFKTPRTRKTKIKELKKVQKEVKEEIGKLQEQEDNNAPQKEQGTVLRRQQQGGKYYRIENTAGINDLFSLKKYLKPMVRELVMKNIETKLNINVKLTIINLSKEDDNGEPQTKPHHLKS